MMGSRRRVAVTGLGVVSPVGNTVKEYWAGLLAGRSGIRAISDFDTEPYSSKIAGLVEDFDPTAYTDAKSARRMERFTQFAVATCKDAWSESGLGDADLDTAEIGCVLGVGIGGIGFTEESAILQHERGASRVSPFMITKIIPNIAPGQVSIELGLRGPTLSIVTACAAGTHAIGEAAEMIRRGAATAMLAGGAESSITPLALAGFCKMKALCADSNDSPATSSRPFDATRAGFVMGEGAGALVLEEWDHAVKRGANILAEVTGYGLSSDAFHVTAPPEGGEGSQRAMKAALKDAGLAPEDIHYINAHGTSTELNDKMETQAIKAVFGDHAKKLAISSTKSMTGHLLGAAGGIEAVASVMSLVEGKIHPTINYHNPDPDCDLDYVPNEARDLPDLRHALSNSLGFGGHNAVLIFSRDSDQ